MFRAEHFERAINVPRGTLREKVKRLNAWFGASETAVMFRSEH